MELTPQTELALGKPEKLPAAKLHAAQYIIALVLVILAAGFDTRAHRFKDVLEDVAVYEIDHPATQEYKRRRVDAALGAAAAAVNYAAVDLTQERLSDLLLRAGVDRSRKT